MVENMSKIKDVVIPKEFTIEAYQRQNIEIDALRSRDELFSIDFDKHKVKTTFQAIFTLGFYTRKKSKETLLAVQEEAGKIDHEIAKMNAELQKLEGVSLALKNTESYFENMVNVYKRLLIRVDSSMNTLYFKSIRFTHELVSKNISLKMLPKVSQKEIEALITSSKILKQMAETKVSNMDKKTIQNYKSQAEKANQEIAMKLKAV